jgi:hypothetical protein
VRKARTWLINILLLALVLRVVLWAIEPLIPYVATALALVMIIGFITYRLLKW